MGNQIQRKNHKDDLIMMSSQLFQNNYRVLIFLVTFVLTGIICVNYNTHKVIRICEDKSKHLEYLASKITHLDEAVTMSARMFAATGNSLWEKRYYRSSNEIDAVIKASAKIIPDGTNNQTKQIYAADSKLRKIEQQVFSLIRRNEFDKAGMMLLGPEYQEYRANYIGGIEEQIEAKRRVIKQNLDDMNRRVVVLFILTLIILLIPAFLLKKVINNIRKWSKFIKENDQILTRKSEELEELNSMLDKKVQTRTKDLEEMNVQLKMEVEERKQVEETLRKANFVLQKNEKASLNILSDLQKANEEINSAQAQLLQSEKMASIGQLAAGIAHEINNPVGFISSNIQTLEEYVEKLIKLLKVNKQVKESLDQGDIEKANKFSKQLTQLEEDVDLEYILKDVDGLLSESQSGVDRIMKIVMDLRTFSREGQDKYEVIKVEQVIDEVLNIVKNELKYKAELKKNYADTPEIKCSTQRLGQVFINLLINAVQAIEKNGIIEVKTYTEDKFVCVEITDNGSGINEGDIKSIFDAFYTTKPVGEGTGLGLSISYEIVKKHGGDIQVTSKLGRGTTFKILLPIYKG